MVDDLSFKPWLAMVQARSDNMLDRLKKWALINSGSWHHDGLKRMADCLVPVFVNLGATYDTLEPASGQKIDHRGEVVDIRYGPVHRFRVRPEAKRRVLLTGHLDTVYPPDHTFQSCTDLGPDKLGGPGVADMKGGLIVMLEALRALEASAPGDALGWEILISSDEEIGSIGSAPHLARAAKVAHIGMTYEPALADGTLAGRRKGSGNFSLVVDGRAAHAGRDFDRGRNAVWALAQAIGALHGLNGGRDGVTVNCAQINGGTAPNIVPDRAWLTFNVRINDQADQGWVDRNLTQIIAKTDAMDGFSARLMGQFNRPPKPLSPANLAMCEAVKESGRALGIDIAFKDTGGCCEGNNLAAAGLPNVDTLGVRGGNIHSSDEFMIPSSLVERAQLSAHILLRCARGDFDSWIARR